MDDALTRRMRL
uniref:Uncharacterized protein n=1 Tax=Arundo donax TaxID=35708 RepID=A0A0A9B3A1_ARUDO